MPSLKSLIAITASWLVSTAMAGDLTNTAFYSVPTAEPTGVRTMTYSGCYSDSRPMINHGPYDFQSQGNCQRICYTLGNFVMGLGNGTDCWCGDQLPALTGKVDDGLCNTPCSGYGGQTCGSAKNWGVYLTGFTLNKIDNYSPSPSSKPSSTGAANSTNSATSAPKKGSNTVGIAIGVIVGIVILGALIGAGFIFMKRKQKREIQELKDQNDVTAFVSGGQQPEHGRPSMWAPDQRMMGASANTRLSNGSIADNQDYSRKILQIRNPDGF